MIVQDYIDTKVTDVVICSNCKKEAPENEIELFICDRCKKEFCNHCYPSSKNFNLVKNQSDRVFGLINKGSLLEDIYSHKPTSMFDGYHICYRCTNKFLGSLILSNYLDDVIECLLELEDHFVNGN